MLQKLPGLPVKICSPHCLHTALVYSMVYTSLVDTLVDTLVAVIDRRCITIGMPRPPHSEGQLIPFSTPIISEDGIHRHFVDGRVTELSRHHIIPFIILRDFFNRLMNVYFQDNEESIPEFGRFLGNLAEHSISLLSMSITEVEDDEIRIGIMKDLSKARELSQVFELGNYTALQNAIALRRLDIYVLFTLFVWLPGNVVVGPRNRADDPGDAFDFHAGRTLPPSDFAVLSDLHSQLQVFRELPYFRDLYFKGIMKTFQRVFESANTFHGFDPSRWAFDAYRSSERNQRLNLFVATSHPKREAATQIEGHEARLGFHYFLPRSLLERFFDAVVLHKGRKVDSNIQKFGYLLRLMADRGINSMRQTDINTYSYGELRFTRPELGAAAEVADSLDTVAFNQSMRNDPYSPYNVMRVMFSELPANSIVGPKARYNSPDDDKIDIALVPFLSGESLRLLLAVHGHLGAYLNGRLSRDYINTSDSGEVTSLDRIVTLLIDVFNSRREAYRFDASRWQFVADIQTGRGSVEAFFKIRLNNTKSKSKSKSQQEKRGPIPSVEHSCLDYNKFEYDVVDILKAAREYT